MFHRIKSALYMFSETKLFTLTSISTKTAAQFQHFTYLGQPNFTSRREH